MSDIIPLEFEHRVDRLLIHFDTDEHFLKLDTFIETARNAQRVIHVLNIEFFQGALDYELIVLPPEEGSFLSKLALWVSAGVASVFAFLNSEVGSAYVEGLTGKTPAEWAQEIGESHQEYVEELQQHEASDTDKIEGTGAAPLPTPSEGDEAAIQCSVKVVVAMTRGVLESSNEELENIGMNVGSLADALDARADFYAACIEDRNVRSIGFSHKDDFPIPRNQFPERAQKPARKEEEDEQPEWMVLIESIYVTSPNWDEEDQQSRQWKGKSASRQNCYFVIDDAEFWHLVKRKELHVEVLDNLKVQWAYQISDGRPKNRRVLRVLEFNGKKLAEPLSTDAIKAILGDFIPTEASKGQPSLFDD